MDSSIWVATTTGLPARRAMSLLRRVWPATSHPHLATLYANAQSGTSAIDRLKRTRELIDTPPPNLPAAIVLARANADAFEWAGARNALANYSSAEPTQAVCLLMAEIEEGQNADQGKAREWLSRAVRAPRDPVWTADGITSDEWEPISPVTGRLDAFEWRVPVSSTAGGSTAGGSTAGSSTAGGRSSGSGTRCRTGTAHRAVRRAQSRRGRGPVVPAARIRGQLPASRCGQRQLRRADVCPGRRLRDAGHG